MDEYTHIIFQLLDAWDKMDYELKEYIMSQDNVFYHAMEELDFSVRS